VIKVCGWVYLRYMSHKAADRIRNVALIGHRGCGKTSLHEAMLFEAGAVNRLGEVEEGSTVSDHEPDEQARGLSINACVSCFQHAEREINLIDTPGDPSFVADAAAALRAADSAVVVVSAVAGVEVQTERLWQAATDPDAPMLVLEEQRAVDVEALRRLGLTRGQAEVLQLLARGRGTDQIAADLFISPQTVRKHLEHVYHRLGVNTREAAVAVAREAAKSQPVTPFTTG
jgi:small GTP-binding protein